MEGKSHSLFRKTLIYGIGTFGSKVLTFLLVPLYSYYLTKEEFGFFDIIITAVNLIVPFVSLQISDGIFRWLINSKNNNNKKREIITTGFVVFIVSCLFVVVFSIGIYFIKPFSEHLLVTILCVVAIQYPILQQIARGLGKAKLFAINGVLYTTFYLICNIVFLIGLKLKVEALIYYTLIGYFLASLILIFQLRLWNYLKFRSFNLRLCKELLTYSIPLIPNTISWWLINSANRYLILIFLGVGANGIYAMANRFPIILLMVNQMFTLAWQENAIQNFDIEKPIDNKILIGLLKIQFILVITLSLTSQFLIERILSNEFAESWKIMPTLYLGVAFLSFSSYYGAFYLAAKRTKEIFVSTAISALISLILTFFLIRFLKLYGVSISMCIGFMYLFFSRVIASKAIVKLKFPKTEFFEYFTITILSIIISSIASKFLSLFSLFIVLIYVLIRNKNEILNVIKKVKAKFI